MRHPKPFTGIKIPDPPQELRGLSQEIRTTQLMLHRLVSIPWKDKSPGFKVGLMCMIQDTCMTLAALVIAQYELMPGIRQEFNRQVDEVIHEIVTGWEMGSGNDH